ncbi:hypothetical protein ACB098_12G117300 [Castanea mollissima]
MDMFVTVRVPVFATLLLQLMRNVSSREQPLVNPNGYGISTSPHLLGQPSAGLTRDAAATSTGDIISLISDIWTSIPFKPISSNFVSQQK